MKTSTLGIILLLFLNFLLPAAAHAYTYGDPNEETLAEIYKKMKAELSSPTPNYAAAQTEFESIKQELDMHMGTEPAQTVLTRLKEKNKDAVLNEMHKILVLNIARRLESIAKDFENYAQNKTLVAKANATYEAISPIIKESDPALDATLRKKFENVLESLGNPGLFGVGQKASNKALFDESRNEILNSLQKNFQLGSLEVGHFGDSQSPGGQADKKDGKQTVDLSEARNWIPIAIILLLLAVVLIYTLRKKKRT